jgi:polyisoprenoid-binding protein YceI
MTMNKRSSIIFSAAALLIVLLVLSGCGGQAPAESLATKTPLAPPQEAAPAAYPPAETVNAPLPEAYPAAENALSAGGPRTFVIDSQASSATYLADEEFFEDALSKLGINAGLNAVEGTTENVSGQIVVNLDGAVAVLGETKITADLSALHTDQDRRDNWIQEDGPRFRIFPEATFTATGADGLPDSYVEGQEVSFQLHGDLKVRDVTLPVTFDVTAAVAGGTLTGTAETRLLMSDLGIEPPSFARTLTVQDEIGIRVNIVARES